MTTKTHVEAFVAELEPDLRDIYEQAESFVLANLDFDTLTESFHLATAIGHLFWERTRELRKYDLNRFSK